MYARLLEYTLHSARAVERNNEFLSEKRGEITVD